MSNHAGIHWYKCDLHLHTMTSECYLNKEDTAQQWVARAKEQGLNVVAVTDHNDYRGIKDIMEEGKAQGIAVFPGVEITCDSSKIHMLILFDTTKNHETVRDFLNRCDIDSELIGDVNGTSLSVFEVCEIAKRRGAMVIAAHIDEFNAINSMNPSNLDKLLSSKYIDAVQVKNVPIWVQYQKDKKAEAMYAKMQEIYGPDATPEEVERWRKCYERAAEAGIPMLAFSDNQASPEESKHGLWGIGSVYTWIQMNDEVNLESIRQSLISPDSRIRTIFESESKPKTEPDFWIRSIEVRNSVLNPHQPIHLDFHPQLNCVIGGRGSGKSAIVRLLSGVYKQIPGPRLIKAFSQQHDFYTQYQDDGYGVFKEDSEIDVCFNWYGIQYRMHVSEIKSVEDQKYSFYRLNPENGEEIKEELDEFSFHSLMCAQVYIQHQIYEIASTPCALLDRVDRSINDMYILTGQRDYHMERLVSISLEMKAAERLLAGEHRIQYEKNWLSDMRYGGSGSDEEAAYIHEMIEIREQAAGFIEQQKERIAVLQQEYKDCLNAYRRCLMEIRRVRTEYLNHVFKDDENYKMEMSPFANHESLRTMLRDLAHVDLEMMSEDVALLESIMFAKKDGVKKYAAVLNALRNDDETPETSMFSTFFKRLIKGLEDVVFVRMVLFRPDDELVIYYHPNGVQRFFPMNAVSAGERATAVLSYALFNGDEPLVIDTPEDDMDNRIIFEEIVTKLKRAKKMRQLIIVTHNANITANADAEMIISMDPRSKFTRVRMQGTMDDEEIRHEICDVMEGTERAFLNRAKKYHLE